jgi:hypothetical protein
MTTTPMPEQITAQLDGITERLNAAREAETKLIGDDLLAALDNPAFQQLQKYIATLERSWRATVALLLRAESEQRRENTDSAKRAAAESKREKADAHRRSEEMLQELLMPSDYRHELTATGAAHLAGSVSDPAGNREQLYREIRKDQRAHAASAR